MSAMDNWLDSLGSVYKEKYSQLFIENGINLEVLERMSNVGLKELGVLEAHRLRIIIEIKKVKQQKKVDTDKTGDSITKSTSIKPSSTKRTSTKLTSIKPTSTKRKIVVEISDDESSSEGISKMPKLEAIPSNSNQPVATMKPSTIVEFHGIVQCTFVGFLKCLMKELKIESFGDIFDFQGYVSDKRVRSHELYHWSELCYYLRVPIFAVVRALTHVRLRGEDFSITLWHLLQDTPTMVLFCRLVSFFHNEVEFNIGRYYITSLHLNEHIDFKEKVLLALIDRSFSDDWTLKVCPTRLTVSITSMTNFASGQQLTDKLRDYKLAMQACGQGILNNDLDPEVSRIVSDVEEDFKNNLYFDLFDWRSLKFHLIGLIYARHHFLRQHKNISKHLAVHSANNYNQLELFLRKTC